MFLQAQAVLVCKAVGFLPVQHEWCLSICWHIWLHHDEHRRALHGLGCGVGPHGQIHCHLCVLVEPQGTGAFLFPTPACSSSAIGKGCWLGREPEQLSLVEWFPTVLNIDFWALRCWVKVYFGLAGALLFQVDNAYWLWTFQGRLLQKNNKDRFCQLLWRPRPATLLSEDQIKVGYSRGFVLTWIWSMKHLVYSLFLRMRFVTQLPFALNVWINTLLCGTSLLGMSADINCIISQNRSGNQLFLQLGYDERV